MSDSASPATPSLSWISHDPDFPVSCGGTNTDELLLGYIFFRYVRASKGLWGREVFLDSRDELLLGCIFFRGVHACGVLCLCMLASREGGEGGRGGGWWEQWVVAVRLARWLLQ